MIKRILKRVSCVLKAVMLVAGGFAVLMVILAFTSAPFWIWYGMAKKKAGIHRPPAFIVVLGGGGMPSESGLMRCWYGAQAAHRFPQAKMIIALPGDSHDSLSSVNLMKKEVELRGISPERILLEDSGTNTRAEAINIKKIITNYELRITEEQQNQIPGIASNPKNRQSSIVNRQSSLVTRQSSLLIVTSPEHLLRAVLTFNRAGFTRVDGLPAFEKTIEADLGFTGRKLGGKGWMWDIGSNITVRYQFWMQLNYELLVLREYFALMYYRIQGWA